MRKNGHGPVLVLCAVLRYIRAGLAHVGQAYYVMYHPGSTDEREPLRPCPGHPERLVPGLRPSAEERWLWAQFGDSRRRNDDAP